MTALPFFIRPAAEAITDARIGACHKIQNHVSQFEGVRLQDAVSIGQHVCYTNDFHPRAITLVGWCDVCGRECRFGKMALFITS